MFSTSFEQLNSLVSLDFHPERLLLDAAKATLYTSVIFCKGIGKR